MNNPINAIIFNSIQTSDWECSPLILCCHLNSRSLEHCAVIKEKRFPGGRGWLQAVQWVHPLQGGEWQSFTTFLLCWGLGEGRKHWFWIFPTLSKTLCSTCPEALCSCVSALNHLGMPSMSLNNPIISVFWAPSSLLGHCHGSHCQHRAAGRDGGGERTCYCVLGTQAVPAMWQKEKEEAEKLIVGQVLDCQAALAMCQCLHLLGTVGSVAVCQHTLLALGPALGHPCLLASHPASPPG